MHKEISYRILITGLMAGLSLGLSAGIANAQANQNTPGQDDMYCSGVVTNQPVPRDTYVISGEDSQAKNTFGPGDYVYINRGAAQGVKVGDEFEVTRAVRDPEQATTWFKYQAMLSRAMGTTMADVGRLRVVHVDPKTSTAEISLSCDFMQRGDIVRPFVERAIPQFHHVKLDPFAPPSGKKMAMVVNTKDFGDVSSGNRIIYINLGSAQGVQVGDYFRIFRYQGTRNETVYQVEHTAYKMYGFGSTPIAYQWNDLPRQVVGEGIVLRTGPNASTVLLTNLREEVFTGEYAEVE